MSPKSKLHVGWSLAALGALSVAVPVDARALDTAVMWNARFAGLRGNLACSVGDPDCNRCVYDVRGQFEAMAHGNKFLESVSTWHFDDGAKQPSGYAATDVLTILPGPFGIGDISLTPGVENGSHFQSLVRSPSASPNLFASYGGVTSGIFMIEAPETSRGMLDGGSLSYIYKGATGHPGGMAAIGEHLLVASDSDTQPLLHVIDVGNAPASGRTYPLPEKVANVSAAQLATGGYVLLTTTTSGENSHRLWYTPSLTDVRLEPMFGVPTEASWAPELDGKEGTEGFENTSLITECGTGNLYMIGANGTPDVAQDNKGVWALYQLTAQRELRFVARNTVKMHGPACNTRASGTAFAAKYGRLGLYCHQKGQQAEQRAQGIRCGIAAHNLATAPGWGPIAEAFAPGSTAVILSIGVSEAANNCPEAVLAADEIAYTELWSTAKTPETPEMPPKSDVGCGAQHKCCEWTYEGSGVCLTCVPQNNLCPAPK
jgi:hypothetical protein